MKVCFKVSLYIWYRGPVALRHLPWFAYMLLSRPPTMHTYIHTSPTSRPPTIHTYIHTSPTSRPPTIHTYIHVTHIKLDHWLCSLTNKYGLLVPPSSTLSDNGTGSLHQRGGGAAIPQHTPQGVTLLLLLFIIIIIIMSFASQNSYRYAHFNPQIQRVATLKTAGEGLPP